MSRIRLRTSIITVFLTSMLLLIAILYVGGTYLFSNEGTVLEKTAEAGGTYLVRHFHSDEGIYDYYYDPVTDEVVDGYNLLRHAGTTYALLELYRARGGKAYLQTAERALEWLLAQEEPCPAPLEMYACLYEGDAIKLGGSGLTILALVESYRATGNEKRLQQAKDLAAWLLVSQVESGEFSVHKQFRDGTLDDHVSLYYPGEAIFGLVRLGEATGNSEYIDAAKRAALWLITVRDAGLDESELEHDHWLLYGLNELDRIAPDPQFVVHAAKLIRAIAVAQHRSDVAAEWVGGFYDPPRSTPTATRLEGVAAAHAIFVRHDDGEMAQQARTIAELGVAFILRTHIDAEKAAMYKSPRRALGGFTGSLEDSMVRIDYVQHSISALLAVDRILETVGEVR